MINRAAVILKYKPPFVKWVNDADPDNDDPGITIESVDLDRNVYLIHEDDAEIENFLINGSKCSVTVLLSIPWAVKL